MNSCKNTNMKQFNKLSQCIALALILLLQPLCTAAESITVSEGTPITLQLNKNLSTKENQEGDSFDALVIEPVYHNGQIAIPKGSTISGSISRITRPGRFKGKAVMHLLFQSIQIPGRGKIPILASLTRIDSDKDADIRMEGTLQSKNSTGRDVGKVIAPGLAGTGIGTLAGGQKGAGIGIGLTNIFWTRGKDLELHRGSTMVISLEEDLKIPVKQSTVDSRQ